MTRDVQNGAGWRLTALVLCALLAGAGARAQGTTSPATGYAWSETVGWINFAWMPRA